MSLEATLEQDLKAAQFAKDVRKVSTLRLVKSALLYVKVAAGTRESELPDDAVLGVLAKESKKRQESADLYTQGGNAAKADDERAEKAIIDAYLPKQLSDADIQTIIDRVIAQLGATDISKMGQVIAAVRQEAGAAADGSAIARLVKERLNP